MTRTQIQLPDEMYAQAREFCRRKEISLAELCRRSLEDYLARWAPAQLESGPAWQLPVLSLGDYLVPSEDWRLLANERDPE